MLSFCPFKAKFSVESVKGLFPPSKGLNHVHDENVRIDFLDITTKVFRCGSVSKRENYRAWLGRVEKIYVDHWQKIGIFDLIKMSKFDVFFWYVHAPFEIGIYVPSNQWNMVQFAPTLLDVASISGLKALGEWYTISSLYVNHKFFCSKLIQVASGHYQLAQFLHFQNSLAYAGVAYKSK